jgi:hypothetical protein
VSAANGSAPHGSTTASTGFSLQPDELGTLLPQLSEQSWWALTEIATRRVAGYTFVEIGRALGLSATQASLRVDWLAAELVQLAQNDAVRPGR